MLCRVVTIFDTEKCFRAPLKLIGGCRRELSASFASYRRRSFPNDGMHAGRDVDFVDISEVSDTSETSDIFEISEVSDALSP